MISKIPAIAAGLCLSTALSAAPRIEWLETVHNFGAFDEDDGKVSCGFRFVNTGDEPVAIISARTSCGCTTSAPPRDIIMPGDTATVTATYDPTGRPGRFEKRIYVDTNCDPSRTTLTVKGVVIATANTLRSRYPIDAGPLKVRTTVVPFGEIKKPGAKSEFFEVYNASRDTVTPVWENLPPYLSALSVHPSIAPGEQMSYTIFFDTYKTSVYGVVNDSIFMRPTPSSEPLKVDVVAMVAEDFSKLSEKQLRNAPKVWVSTDALDFGSITGDSPVSRTFEIKNRGKNSLKIRRVQTVDRGVSVSIDRSSIDKGKSAIVTVTVNPSELPSEMLNARILIITNDPATPSSSVRAVGLKD